MNTIQDQYRFRPDSELDFAIRCVHRDSFQSKAQIHLLCQPRGPTQTLQVNAYPNTKIKVSMVSHVMIWLIVIFEGGPQLSVTQLVDEICYNNAAKNPVA